jgi:hypothetical protein
MPSAGVDSLPDSTFEGVFTNGSGAGDAPKSPAAQSSAPIFLGPPAYPIKKTQAKFAKIINAAGRIRRGSILHRQASQQTPDLERVHHLSGVLSVQGLIIGHVCKVSDVMRGGIIPGWWVTALGWGADKDTDPNRVPESLWRTLVADRTPRGGHPPPWYKRACLHALHDPANTDGQGNLHTSTQSAREISENSAMYLRRVETVVWNRRLFLADVDGAGVCAPAEGAETVLKGPLFGIGPSDTAEWQRVCILLGCSVPVVLANGMRRGVSRIVGEAYVHGIMDGEAIRPCNRLETFLLE